MSEVSRQRRAGLGNLHLWALARCAELVVMDDAKKAKMAALRKKKSDERQAKAAAGGAPEESSEVKKAKLAAIWTEGLCIDILKGMRDTNIVAEAQAEIEAIDMESR